MRPFLLTALLLTCGISSYSQEALGSKPPQALGSIRTIAYKYHSVTFNRDKTRIDEGVSNGRNVVWLVDDKGRPLKSEIFEKDGRSSGTQSLYTYDSGGRLTSIVHNLFGTLSYTETFAYLAKRLVKITREFKLVSGVSTEIETDEYDKNGRIIKASFQDEEGTRTESYKYDDKGNPTEFVGIDSSGKQWIREKYDYKFDRYGNWTERKSKVLAAPNLGIPPETTISRKLTYY